MINENLLMKKPFISETGFCQNMFFRSGLHNSKVWNSENILTMYLDDTYVAVAC